MRPFLLVLVDGGWKRWGGEGGAYRGDGRVQEMDEGKAPELAVQGEGRALLQRDGVLLRISAVGVDARDDVAALARSEKAPLALAVAIRHVNEQEVSDAGCDDGEEALDDVYPAPAVHACQSLHVHQAVRQETGEA